MAGDIDGRLKAMGVELPDPGAPAANYVPTVATKGTLLFVSGQVTRTADGVAYVGKLGREYSIEDGQKAARICAINLLGAIKAAVGDLERVVRIVKVVGFVNAVPEFADAHKVINGASDFLTDVLGERGKHARSAIGVGSLPLGVAVEVEAIVEIA